MAAGSSVLSLSLKGLQCFRTIVDTGSATAAAEQMQLTQPGVSRLLGQLEEQIGFELFRRAKGRLLPTQEALAFYKEVDLALQSVERVSLLARNLQNADFGTLSIVAPPSFSEGLLSRVLSRFIMEHPNVNLSLDSQSVETAKEMVALRAVDCGFIKLPADHPGLRCRPLVRAGTVCALPAAHPLCKRKIIAARDLADEPLILLGKGRSSRLQLEEAFMDAGASLRVRVETHTVGSACALVRGRAGIAIINEMLGMQYRGKGLEMRRFRPDLKHDYAFMTAVDTPMNRVTRRFFEYCRTYFAEHRAEFTLPRGAASR
jgi:DNA-binding transcriptional LysR family regulator